MAQKEGSDINIETEMPKLAKEGCEDGKLKKDTKSARSSKASSIILDDDEVVIEDTSSLTMKMREKQKERERELKTKLAALKITKELEKKKRMLKKRLELEEAEEEMRRARSKAELMKKRQMFEEENAVLEQQQSEAMLMAELEMLKEELGGRTTDTTKGHNLPPDGGQVEDRQDPVSPLPQNQSDEHLNFQQQKAEEIKVKESPEMEPQGFQSHQRQHPLDADSSAIPQQRSTSMMSPRSSPFTPRLERMTPPNPPQEDPTLSQVVHDLLRFSAQQHLPQPDLEAFRGNPLNFLTFKKNFRYVVEDRTQDPSRRLELLLRFTKGEPHELIKECPHIQPPSTAYAIAMNLLEENYGQTINITNAYKEKAKAYEQIKSGDSRGLRSFSIFLNNCCHVKGTQDLAAMDSVDFLKILAGKLPPAMQHKWISRVGAIRDVEHRDTSLIDLATFVSREARNQNDPRVEGLGYQRPPQGSNQYKGKPFPRNRDATKSFATHTQERNDKQPSRSTPTCAFCGASSNHRTDECRKFQALTIQERGEACMRRGMCFRCLHRGHLKKKCNSKIQCEKCKMYHHTLLHDPKMERRENTPEASKTDSPNAVPTVPTGSTKYKGNRQPESGDDHYSSDCEMQERSQRSHNICLH